MSSPAEDGASPSIMDSLRAVSAWTGMPLSFVVDLVDALKVVHAERAYAELSIEAKRGKIWRFHCGTTKQYGDAPQ